MGIWSHFVPKKLYLKNPFLGAQNVLMHPFSILLTYTISILPRFITFHYLLLTFLLCLPSLTNCITFRKLLLTFLLPLICYTTGVAKIITPNWNWQQILSCKFSHFCHNVDVYCLYCWVMQIENPLWLFFSSN